MIESKDLLFARAAAVNVIEGRLKDVVALLDELAYSDLSTPGMREARDQWKATIDAAHQSMRDNWPRRQERRESSGRSLRGRRR